MAAPLLDISGFLCSCCGERPECGFFCGDGTPSGQCDLPFLFCLTIRNLVLGNILNQTVIGDTSATFASSKGSQLAGRVSGWSAGYTTLYGNEWGYLPSEIVQCVADAGGTTSRYRYSTNATQPPSPFALADSCTHFAAQPLVLGGDWSHEGIDISAGVCSVDVVTCAYIASQVSMGVSAVDWCTTGFDDPVAFLSCTLVKVNDTTWQGFNVLTGGASLLATLTCAGGAASLIVEVQGSSIGNYTLSSVQVLGFHPYVGQFLTPIFWNMSFLMEVGGTGPYAGRQLVMGIGWTFIPGG